MAHPPTSRGPSVDGQGLWVRALGPIAAQCGGRPVALGGHKQRTVLALLVLRANVRVSTDDLVEAVWGPGESTSRWLRTLQVYVANLRGLLHLDAKDDGLGAALTWDGHGYQLRLGAEHCDIAAFRQGVEQGRELAARGDTPAAADRLRHATHLWAEDAFEELADCALTAPDLAELTELRAGSAEDLMVLELALGRHTEVLPELTGLAAMYPLRERLRALQMTALYRCGHQPEALEVFGDVRRRLVEELGVDPTPELRNLELAILRQDPFLDPPKRGRPGPRILLPQAPNELVGRGADVARLCDLLEDEHVRVVTVHGPGGVGKTRLALAAAHRVAKLWPDGACWVDLAAVSTPDLILGRIAHALDLPSAAQDEPATALRQFLTGRRLLLVLDNLEQLEGAATEVANLVASVPSLTVLATSRVVLRLANERAFLVTPLGLQTDDHVPNANLRQSPAVTLFVQRARARNNGFELSDADLPSVVELCRRLDGLPLAIELAAARTLTLSPTVLLARLAQARDLLAGGTVDQPVRQRTLWLTFAWSHDLLAPVERSLFRRFAVFCDPATADDVEQVCFVPGRDQIAALDATEALVRHNLLNVRADPDTGEPQFSMLQTTREFALERLRRSTELEATRRRHAEHVATAIGAAARDGPAAERVAACRQRPDDVRAALGWAIEPGHDVTVGLQLVSALEDYWTTTGQVREGQQWCTRVLEAAGEGADAALRGTALNAAGTMAWLRGEFDDALRLHGEALEIQLGEGDSAGVAWSRLCVASQHYMREAWGPGDALNRQALVAAQSCGAERVAVLSMVSLAVSAKLQGRPEESLALLLECLDRVRALADEQLVCLVLLDLAGLDMDDGRYAEAFDRIQEALDTSHALADVHNGALALSQLAELVLATGDPVRAARWLGCLAAFTESSGTATLDADIEHLSKLQAQTVRDGGVAAAAAFHEGQALELSEAVSEAIVATQPPERLPAR